MEFPLPKSQQQTLMERIFRNCDVIPEGVISKKHLQNILHPDLNIDDEELQKLIDQHDCKDGSGQLDFDSVTKIIFNFLMEQSIEDSTINCWKDHENNQSKGENQRLSIDDFIVFSTL